MYDESILVYDEDGDEEEYELLAGRKRAGVSPVRRAPFPQTQHYHQRQQQQRPSRSVVRQTREFQLSEEDDDEDSLGIMSGEEGGSPVPPPPQQQEDPARKKSMSTKDFTPPPSQQQQQQQQLAPGSGGKQHENLISLASNFAKKMISSGSDKSKEKLPPDIGEATRREQKGASGHPPLADVRKPQEQQPSSSKGHPLPPQQQQQQPPQQQQQKPPQPQHSRSAEEEEDDEDDEDEYDDVNMAQIEGLLNRVERPPSTFHTGGRFLPRPPPGSPPPHIHQRRPPSSRAIVDHGGAGEPYRVRQPHNNVPLTPTPSTAMQTQFQPGFGPATSNLMTYTRGGVRGGPLSEEDTSPEISISEGDMDLTRMEELIKLYSDPATSSRAIMPMPMPTQELSNLTMVDDEVMENILVHRKMWEYDLDMKREALRRRTLVMSDFPGVHAPGHEIYNPQEYEHLNVSPEIKEVFHYITRYEPPIIGSQMDLKLKPFIPEYYPSVGDIDAFIKVTHPEVVDDTLGIKCLDEPSPFQSDPSVLDLRLRALAKQSSSKSVVVKKIDNVGKNSKVIENWIKDISDLHRSKPSPSVHYSKPMPDIDTLIQEWPPQLEGLLKSISLPSAELDCDLSTYVDLVCNLLDIPVYKSRIQSLHVLFTLYATYKHFNHYGPLGLSGGGGGSGGGNDSVRLDDGDVDRLQINN